MTKSAPRIFVCLIALFVSGQFAKAGAAPSPSVAGVRQQVERSYAVLSEPNREVFLRWTLLTTGAPSPPSADGRPAASMKDPVTGLTLNAVFFSRAWITSDGRWRVEQNPAQMISGPDVSRWSVRLKGANYYAGAGTLSSQRVSLNPIRQFDSATDDVFTQEEALAPLLMARILLDWMGRTTDVVLVAAPGANTLTLRSESTHTSFSINSLTGMIADARCRLRAGKDLFVEYFGELAPNIYPAPQPAFARTWLLEPNQPATDPKHLFRYDEVKIGPITNAPKFEWTSISQIGIDEARGVVIGPTGEVDDRRTRGLTAQRAADPLKTAEAPASPGQLPQPVERSTPWVRWLLVAGLVSVSIALAIAARGRGGRVPRA